MDSPYIHHKEELRATEFEAVQFKAEFPKL